MANPRVSYRLNHPKDKTGNLKSELCPILVEFYCKLFRMEISTGLKCYPSNWIHQRATSKEKDFKGINTTLSRIETEMLEVWASAKGLPVNEIKSLLKGVVREDIKPVEEKKTLIQAVQLFIAQYEREKETGTVKRYKGLLKKLLGFEAETKLNMAPLLFENLDFNFYDAFKKFLYSRPNPNYNGCSLHHHLDGHYVVRTDSDGIGPIGLFDDVVFKYLVNLKTICAWAAKRGYAVHPSYKEWEILKREYPPITLTKPELESLEALHLKEKHLDTARDFLCLECRTGQRISDLRRFNKSDVSGDVWTFFQKKGNRIKAKLIELPLDGFAAPALAILEKYNYQLPKISEQKLNEHIKTICSMAGIDEPMFIERWAGNKKIRIPGKKFEFISTHTGKKSFITILAGDGVSVAFLSLLTGTSQRTIEKHYLGKISLDKVREQLKKGGDGKASMRIAN